MHGHIHLGDSHEPGRDDEDRQDAADASRSGPRRAAPDSNGWYNRLGRRRLLGDRRRLRDGQLARAARTPARTRRPPPSPGICTDVAGNTSAGAFSLQYDSTAPGVAAAASRAPDANGWYNRSLSVSFSQSPGDLSGVGTCSPAAAYNGPDSATASVSGTCTDRAGNTSAPLALGLKYDVDAAAGDRGGRTAPPTPTAGSTTRSRSRSSRPPATSPGPTRARAPIGYSGPDDAAASRSGTCTRPRGEHGARPPSLTFKYDATRARRDRRRERGRGRQRLVQPAADDLVRARRRRPLRPRYLHRRSDLQRSRRRERLALRHLHRPGRQPQRPGCRVVQVRRDCAAGSRVGRPGRRRERLVQPRADGLVLRRPPATSPVRTPAARPSLTAGQTRPQRHAQEPAPTARGTRARLWRSHSSTTPRRRSRSPRPAGPQNSNGWFNRSFTISFAQAPGDLSGPDTCTASVTYSGPDAASPRVRARAPTGRGTRARRRRSPSSTTRRPHRRPATLRDRRT